jgi:hypothetical protein
MIINLWNLTPVKSGPHGSVVNNLLVKNKNIIFRTLLHVIRPTSTTTAVISNYVIFTHVVLAEKTKPLTGEGVQGDCRK